MKDYKILLFVILQIIVLYFIVVTVKVFYRLAFNLPITPLSSFNIFNWARVESTKSSSTTGLSSVGDPNCDSFFRTQTEKDTSSKCVTANQCADIAYKEATVPEEFCFTKDLPGYTFERKMIDTQKSTDVYNYLNYITGRQVNGYDISDSNVVCGATTLETIKGTSGLYECSKKCDDKSTVCTGFEFKPVGDTCKLMSGNINNIQKTDNKSMCYVKMSTAEKDSITKWIENPAERVV
jgi:hypothetical protein